MKNETNTFEIFDYEKLKLYKLRKVYTNVISLKKLYNTNFNDKYNQYTIERI